MRAASRMRMSDCGSSSVRSSETALMSSSVESTGFSPFAMIQLLSIVCVPRVMLSLHIVLVMGGRAPPRRRRLGHPDRERQPRAGGLTVVAVVVDCFHERRFAPEERRLAYLLLDRRGRHRVAEEQQQGHRLDDDRRPYGVEGDLTPVIQAVQDGGD